MSVFVVVIQLRGLKGCGWPFREKKKDSSKSSAHGGAFCLRF
jgi:hypothetical protein